MCAASPTKNNFCQLIGSQTNDLKGAIDFSIDSPVIRVSAACVGRRFFSSSQNFLSVQFSILSVIGVCI